MPRIALDLNTAEDRQKVKGQWRVAPGLVPGEPNEGLTAQLKASPARQADYDDSRWECARMSGPAAPRALRLPGTESLWRSHQA